MTELALTGLSGTNPLGAMAAFGLLRVLAFDDEVDASLAWTFTDDWRAILHTSSFDDSEALIAHLVERQRNRAHAPFLTWAADLKVEPNMLHEHFQALLGAAKQVASPSPVGSRELLDFSAAFGSESVTDAKGNVKPTAFHMTAGQQRFLKSARETARSLDPEHRSSKRQSEKALFEECVEAFREALIGPWRYHDRMHSLGWDPTTEGLHALSDISPSTAGARSVRGAVWLAFESLPLFPCFPVAARGGTRLMTTGFGENGQHFSWPLWTCPIRLAGVRSLLASHEIVGDDVESRIMRAQGIAAVYRSECHRNAHGYGTFRNAVRVS